MNAARFVAERKKDWDELEELLAGSSRSRRFRASPEGTSRFATLFRSTCADLARARALSFPDDLVEYLNSLAARAHNLFYVAPPFPLGRVLAFFTTLFPLAVRRNAAYVAAGLLLFYGPMVGVIALGTVDDRFIYPLVPEAMLQQFEKMYESSPERGGPGDVMMAGFYVRNNIGIAFRCFASGIFFGLGSLFILLYNGIILGAVVGFVGRTPSAMNLLSFIVSHGPLELTAISLAGAAGLRLGFGAIVTGNRRRSVSLRLAAKDSVLLVLGAAALLLAAAMVEAFYSASPLPRIAKYAFGAASVLFLVYYLGLMRVRAKPVAAGRP